ncbi:MAG: tRNA lysidine(34) synthetase TilS ['Bonamia sp.' little leaf phytoplasma]|nr:tRNA lysidine(34) synthetase TilS ['Bonamia sp.' little leaf phytoplasma]
MIIETQIFYPYLLGYSGMQPIYLIEKFVFLKPFLYLSKDKIINYANQKKISFLEDETNQNDYYARNRIRKFVIPYLQKEHNFLKNIYKFHIQITEIYQLVKEQTNLFLKYHFNKQYYCLEVFCKLNIVIQKNIILSLLDDKKISKNFVLINNIIKLLNNNNKPYCQVKLNDQWQISKKYYKWQLSPLSRIENNINTLKPILYLHHDHKTYPKYMTQKEIFYNDGQIIFPLIIRTRLSGDILEFKFGKQKLKKFLINCKIPITQRNKLLLIVDQTQKIIWIPCLYHNETLGEGKIITLAIEKHSIGLNKM